MIDFQKLNLSQKTQYDQYLKHCGERGCEYSLANLYMWGKQKVAFLHSCMAFFSQYERRSVYPFPIGNGDLPAVLDAIIEDAHTRGLECRFVAMTAEDCGLLEERYPGKFVFHPDRTYSDYVYAIEKLADLPGRKYQRKRNHVNRFRQNHPDCATVEITPVLLPKVKEMAESWYAGRMAADPDSDFQMEKKALERALENWDALALEGIALVENGEILAMTAGSRLNEDTFDVHFEKAVEEADGAYAAINQTFASYLHKKYPDLCWLNREDDMGLEGLRKAKLSYYPDHLVVKFWASLREEEDDY